MRGEVEREEAHGGGERKGGAKRDGSQEEGGAAKEKREIEKFWGFWGEGFGYYCVFFFFFYIYLKKIGRAHV